MKPRNNILTLLALLILAGASQASSGDLQIYLPRAIEVPAGQLSLGTIAVVRCDDSELIAKVFAIGMGRAPWHAEKITVDRRTILSRLASHGISARKVKLTGSERIEVTLSERVVPGKELLSKAQAFLKDLHPVPPTCTWEITSKPKDVILPGGPKLDLQVKLIDDGQKGFLNVMVDVISGQEILASQKLSFKIFYPNRRIIAIKPIISGEKLTEENIRIDTVNSSRAESADYVNPFGMIVRHRIHAGTTIKPIMLREPEPPMLVKRSDAVVIRINGECFSVMGMGIALENGRLGQSIRVKNKDSSRIITAKVAPDGAVEPNF